MVDPPAKDRVTASIEKPHRHQNDPDGLQGQAEGIAVVLGDIDVDGQGDQRQWQTE
jgi:hypothetical protein